MVMWGKVAYVSVLVTTVEFTNFPFIRFNLISFSHCTLFNVYNLIAACASSTYNRTDEYKLYYYHY